LCKWLGGELENIDTEWRFSHSSSLDNPSKKRISKMKIITKGLRNEKERKKVRGKPTGSMNNGNCCSEKDEFYEFLRL
jgi:hypothetical protein